MLLLPMGAELPLWHAWQYNMLKDLHSSSVQGLHHGEGHVKGGTQNKLLFTCNASHRLETTRLVPTMLRQNTVLQASTGEGVHAAVLCGAEAQSGPGGTCCSLLHHQGKPPLNARHILRCSLRPDT